MDAEAAAGPEGRDLVRALSVALKTIQLYPDEAHPGVLRALEALARLIGVHVHRRGTFALTLVGDYLFVAGRRLRFDVEGYVHVACLMDVFRRGGVGGLAVDAAPPAEALGRSLRILQAVPPGTPPGADRLAAALQEQGVAGVNFLPVQVPVGGAFETSSPEALEAAARAYARALVVARDLFAKARAQAPLDIRRAKRAVRGLADLVIQGEPAILAMTALKDPEDYLARHAVHVCLFALAAGQHVGYQRQGLTALGLAGFLHDLGRTRWPPDLAHKSPPLSPADRRWVALYPAYSAMVFLQQAGFSEAAVVAARAILDHARHADLSGYPPMHRRSAPSLAGRILSVAHYFDARTSSRPHEPVPLTPEQAWTEITRQTGKQFDRLALAAVQQAVGVYPPGTLVRLTTRESALVLAPPPTPEAALRPPVVLVRDAEGHACSGPVLDLAAAGGGVRARAIVRSLDPREVAIDLAKYLLPQPAPPNLLNPP